MITDKLIDTVLKVEPDATIKDVVKFARYSEPVKDFLLKEAKIKNLSNAIDRYIHKSA